MFKYFVSKQVEMIIMGHLGLLQLRGMYHDMGLTTVSSTISAHSPLVLPQRNFPEWGRCGFLKMFASRRYRVGLSWEM